MERKDHLSWAMKTQSRIWYFGFTWFGLYVVKWTVWKYYLYWLFVHESLSFLQMLLYCFYVIFIEIHCLVSCCSVVGACGFYMICKWNLILLRCCSVLGIPFCFCSVHGTTKILIFSPHFEWKCTFIMILKRCCLGRFGWGPHNMQPRYTSNKNIFA